MFPHVDISPVHLCLYGH